MAKIELPDTQPQTQSQRSQWHSLESQSIEPIIWGRLYAKSIRLRTLGIRITTVIIQNTSNHYDLCFAEFSAGRNETNDLVLTPKELPENILSRISKVHFKLKRDLRDPFSPTYIYDYSRNGTFINGEIIGFNEVRILQNDDIISIAHTRYKAYLFKDLSPMEGLSLPTEIRSVYYISKRLGSGACGVVNLVYDKKTCTEYAMKHIKKNKFTEYKNNEGNQINDQSYIMNEVNIMKSLKHPCVIKMHDIVDKADAIFIVLELMKGGDLISRIIHKKRISEDIAKLYFFQMCHAVKYLHDHGITHRDIKPDNVLLESTNDITLIKVSDFGLSKFVTEDSVLKTLCGTPLYVAPEVLLNHGRGSYNKKIDIWSLGVVLFLCLSGSLPFNDEPNIPAVEKIKVGKYVFNSRQWRHVSLKARNVVANCLIKDPQVRPSIDGILKHSWFKDVKMLKKAEKLMGIKLLSEPIITKENEDPFLEPPIKRRRT